MRVYKLFNRLQIEFENWSRELGLINLLVAPLKLAINETKYVRL